MIRVLLGGILGGIIGLERKKRFKYAGFKTHFLVGLGSALIMVVSQYGFPDAKVAVDPSRIAAQVVSGIGFLGAGTIIINKGGVKGLTTAAGLWVTSAIGLATGCGLYDLAAIAVLFVLIGLELGTFFTKGFKGQLLIRIVGDTTCIDRIWDMLREEGLDILGYELQEGIAGRPLVEFKVKIIIKKRQKQPLMKKIQAIKGIEFLKVEYNSL